jgi:hypothetical protein
MEAPDKVRRFHRSVIGDEKPQLDEPTAARDMTFECPKTQLKGQQVREVLVLSI